MTIYFDKEAETMSWDNLKKIWDVKGKQTLQNLYDNNPTIRKKYDEAGVSPSDYNSVEDIGKFPFILKQDFLNNYPDGMVCTDKAALVRMHATSGSTGNKPTCGFYTQHDLDTWSKLCARNLAAMGMTSKDVFQNTASAGLFTGGFGYAQASTELGSMLIPFGPGKTKKQLQFFKDFGVTAIHAIPSFALRIAEVMEQENITKDDIPLKYAILGAEGWSESVREMIESRLGVKAHDNYGLTEACGPGVSVECTEQNGLHIWSDHFYPEIINSDTGKVLPLGETGELVLTSLWKEAMPIFRYRTGDITRLRKSDCKCGRTGFIMDRVKGRIDDMVVINGVNIYPTMLEHEVFKLSEYFTDIYLIMYHHKGSLDAITLHVEPKDGLDLAKMQKELSDNLKEATMLSVRIKLFKKGALPRQEGKAVRYHDLRTNKKDYDKWLVEQSFGGAELK